MRHPGEPSDISPCLRQGLIFRYEYDAGLLYDLHIERAPGHLLKLTDRRSAV